MNPENVISDKDNFDEISLKEILLKIRAGWRFLVSKWLVIVAFGIIGGILGFVYATIKKPIYTATTTFVLETGDGNGLGQYAGLASMAGIDIGSGGGGIFQGDNILELYKSRTMIEKTLLSEIKVNDKKGLLIDQFIAFNKLRESWDKNKDLRNINFAINKKGFTRLQDSVLGVIVQDINMNYLKVAKPDKKLNIIKVDVKAKDELFAKLFNEQIVKNVNDFYTQTKTKKSLENVNILEQKTDSVRAVMNGAIYSAAAVADATPNLNPTRQIQRIAPVQRSQFTVETNKIVLGELVKNLELGRLSLRKEMPLIQVIDIPVLPLEKERLGRAKGIVLGGFLFGFLSVLFLFIRKLISDIVKS